MITTSVIRQAEYNKTKTTKNRGGKNKRRSKEKLVADIGGCYI